MPKDPTAAARPRHVRAGAPLRERLTQPGRMPAEIPPGVIASLALIQGLTVDVRELLERQNRSPILWSGIVHLGSHGYWTRNWETQYQCVSVSNLGAGTVTIAPGAAMDPTAPPVSGAGVHQVPPGAWGRFATMGNSLTVYGPINSYVDVAVATRWVDGL